MQAYENQITMEQLAATIAHEIKNPLQLLRSNLQLMQLDEQSNRYKKNYDLMYREIERINSLVVDFINTANPMQYKFEVINLSTLINEVAQIFSGSIKENGIAIKYDIDSDVKIRADADKLKQVLINIVKNAIEAVCEMDEQRTIEICTKLSAERVSIIVKDNGVGMSESTMQSLGTPYFTTKQKGSGLGISLSKYIIGKHDGFLNIASIESLGTTVSIDLEVI